MRTARLIVLAAAMLALLGACGGDEEASKSPEATGPSSSSVPFDQAFIDAMVPHHRSAIEMATAAKTRGLTQPDLVTIADDILVSQQREIDQMLDWRAQWFGSRKLGPVLPEVLGVSESVAGMDHGGPDEILEATDADATFAELMIPHHESAVTMAEVALRKAQHQELQQLAKDIIAAQKREIDMMEEHAGAMEH